MKEPKIYWIDLFSGAGGTSTGIPERLYFKRD